MERTRQNIYYIDGEFLPADNARIPVDDLAVLRGYGIFDLLRTYHGRPFMLGEHLDRLRHSADQVNMKLPWTRNELIRVVRNTLKRNAHHRESNVRVIITGGSSPDFITPPDKPRLLVLVTPLPTYPEWWYTRGVKLITVTSERNIPGVKSTNYMAATMALAKAREREAIEAVYVNGDGHVLEGATSNIFAFFKDRLFTPDTGILPGITRKIVLEIVQGVYDIKAGIIARDELVNADEVFITSSNKEVVPVVQLDRLTIGDSTPGPRTKAVMKLYSEFVKNHYDQEGDNRLKE